MKLDLNLSEDEEMLRKTATDFMRRDAPKEVVQALQDTETGCNDELWQKIVDMGWTGIIIPEKYGGIGSSYFCAGLLFEALGSGPLPGPLFSSSILGSLIVMEAGSEAQRQQVLLGVVAGKTILALALTEPEYGWEPADVQTTAVSQGSDFVINGLKLFVIDGQAATHFIVAARTGENAAQGISLFLVEAKAAGISRRLVEGFLAGRSSEVKLDGVKVPASAMLGAKDAAWEPLQRAIAKSIPILSAYKVGGSQALVDAAIEYSRVRVQFGQAVGRFQRVQDLIIEMVNHKDGAKWATYETLWKLDNGRPAAQSIHMTKAVASQGYWDVCTLAHQAFSGISYSKEHPVSFHTRASRALYNYLGEPSSHKQKLARLVVGL